MDRELRTMWKTYDTINEWIRFSDTKAAAVLAANGAILTIIFSKSLDHVDFLLDHYALLAFLLLGFAAGLISIFYSIICLSPSLNIGENASIIYFGHIAKKYENCTNYRRDVKKNLTTESDEINQIVEQVWINSKIAWSKYNRVKWAIRFFFGVVIFISISGLIALCLYQWRS